MRLAINKALDQLELVFTPDMARLEVSELTPLIGTLEAVQDGYTDVIQEALSLLTQNKIQESHDRLQRERDSLAGTFRRIESLVEQVADTEQPTLKLIIEYLFTRARLVDELKMFPQYGLELLERMSLNESLDETIHYMETAMTGKQGLFTQLTSQLRTIQASTSET